MDTARAEADHLVAEAERAAGDLVGRRKRLAAVKIAQAESQASAGSNCATSPLDR